MYCASVGGKPINQINITVISICFICLCSEYDSFKIIGCSVVV